MPTKASMTDFREYKIGIFINKHVIDCKLKVSHRADFAKST